MVPNRGQSFSTVITYQPDVDWGWVNFKGGNNGILNLKINSGHRVVY